MKNVLAAAATLILAAACQMALAPRMAVFGAKPDLLLVAVTVLAMKRGTDAAASVGFLAGLLHGGMTNANMAAYVISRVLGAIGASVVSRSTVAATAITVTVASLVSTGIASLAFMLLGVPKDLLGWVLATLGTIVYNAALVGIVFAILGRARFRT